MKSLIAFIVLGLLGIAVAAGPATALYVLLEGVVMGLLFVGVYRLSKVLP